MKLVKDWKRVLILSMSFWAQVAGLLVLVVPELIYKYTGIDSDPNTLWWLGTLLLLFGLVGRLYEQATSALVEWFKILAVLVIIFSLAIFASSQARANDQQRKTLRIATPLISKWEGLRLEAYRDIGGIPTICYGSTLGIEMGTVKSRKECDLLLREEILVHRNGWLNYLKPDTLNWLPPTRDAAYTSLAYNIGVHKAGRSTATRRLNIGNIIGGCQALGWWNRQGSRVIRGLVNRRTEETELCLRHLE